jgi:hypothetical protein
VRRRSDLADLGVRVKVRPERRLLLYEWACLHCASLLVTNLYPEEMAPLHDLHAGAGPGQEAALARPVVSGRQAPSRRQRTTRNPWSTAA